MKSMFSIKSILCVIAVAAASFGLAAEDRPPTIEPFAPKTDRREDALPGRIEMSDGAVHRGLIHLTRDKRLKIFDRQLKRQREIPLRAVRRIECKVKREWMQKEWKFKETTSDEKIYTGRSYPAREYLHTITLRDGRTITGPLSALVYLRPRAESSEKRPAAERFILHKRDKGEVGEKPDSLVYVKRITFEGKPAEQR